MFKASPFWTAALLAALLDTGCVHTKSTIPFHEEAFKDPYFALIYVYREEDSFQSDRSWGVFLDEDVRGRLRQGAYFTLRAAPGLHSLYVGGNASRSGDVLPATLGALGAVMEDNNNKKIKARELRAKSGEIYYFRCKGAARDFLTRDQAIGILRTMKYDDGYWHEQADGASGP
jgi:hypothetical protein